MARLALMLRVSASEGMMALRDFSERPPRSTNLGLVTHERTSLSPRYPTHNVSYCYSPVKRSLVRPRARMSDGHISRQTKRGVEKCRTRLRCF